MYIIRVSHPIIKGHSTVCTPCGGGFEMQNGGGIPSLHRYLHIQCLLLDICQKLVRPWLPTRQPHYCVCNSARNSTKHVFLFCCVGFHVMVLYRWGTWLLLIAGGGHLNALYLHNRAQ